MRLGLIYELSKTLDVDHLDKRVRNWMATHSLGELEAILPFTEGKEREILEVIVECLRAIAEDLYSWKIDSEMKHHSVEISVSTD